MNNLLTKLPIYSTDTIEYVNKCDLHKERSNKTIGQDSINHFYYLEGGTFENYHVHVIDINLAQSNFSLSF